MVVQVIVEVVLDVKKRKTTCKSVVFMYLIGNVSFCVIECLNRDISFFVPFIYWCDRGEE